jgi:hypothetical protein
MIFFIDNIPQDESAGVATNYGLAQRMQVVAEDIEFEEIYKTENNHEENN